MEQVAISDTHPMGVKTSYSPYVQKEFVEIVAETGIHSNSKCGLIPQLCESSIHPKPGEPVWNWLHSIPTGMFEPDSFVTGSRAAIEAVGLRMATGVIDYCIVYSWIHCSLPCMRYTLVLVVSTISIASNLLA